MTWAYEGWDPYQSEFTSRRKTKAEQASDIRGYIEKMKRPGGELDHWTDSYQRYGGELAKERLDGIKGEIRRAQQELRDLDRYL